MNLDEEERNLEYQDSGNGAFWFEWFVMFAYAPEISLGISTEDEARDIIDGEVVRPQGKLVAKIQEDLL